MAAVFVFVAAFFVFFILLPDPAAASFDQSRDVSLLPYLGKFEYNQHNVKGHVYQVRIWVWRLKSGWRDARVCTGITSFC